MKITNENLFLQFRGFYYTALFKSVSLAAEILNVSQPAVSLQLKTLQTSINKTLFYRKQGKMLLTPDGSSLFNDIKPIIDSMDDVYKKHSQKNKPKA